MKTRKTINKLIKPFGVKLVPRRPRQSKEPEGKFPTIFTVTLPKSGSVYLLETLSRTLDAHPVRSSLTYYPGDVINLTGLREMMRGGYILQSHVNASRQNIDIVNAYVDRLVVHVRDPRQHLLSLIHYFERLHNELPEALLKYTPPLPADYFGWDFDRIIDWHLTHYLPTAVDWISGWVEAARSELSGRVLLTEYGDLQSDISPLIEGILDFYGIDPVTVVPAQKDVSTNFRRGDPDEWRTVFSASQIERAATMIPDPLREKFNWPA